MVITGMNQSFRELRLLLSVELTYKLVKCGTSQLGSGLITSKVSDTNTMIEFFSLNLTRLLHHKSIT